MAGEPLQTGSITLSEAFARGAEPFRGFMTERTDPETYDALADVAPRPGAPDGLAGEDTSAVAPLGAGAPLSVLVPSFMLSEVQRAFEVGFLIALPFLIIDLVVSAGWLCCARWCLTGRCDN